CGKRHRLLRARLSPAQQGAQGAEERPDAVFAVVWGLAENRSSLFFPQLPLGSRLHLPSTRKELPMPRPASARAPKQPKSFLLQQLAHNALTNRRACWPEQTVALCWVTTPDAPGWGPPLQHHVGEKVTEPDNRECSRVPQRFPPTRLRKGRFGAITEKVRL